MILTKLAPENYQGDIFHVQDLGLRFELLLATSSQYYIFY